MNDNNIVSTDETKLDLEQGKDGLAIHYHYGKIIVAAIATINVVFSIISSFIISWNITGIIVSIGLSMALYNGVRWVWGLHVFSSFLAVIIIPFVFLSSVSKGMASNAGFIIWYALCFINAVASFVLLAYNKNVCKFLNSQQHH